MKKIYGILILTLFGFTDASAITMSFSGIVGNIGLGTSSNPIADAGDIVSGTFSFDPQGVLDSNSWNAVGEYSFDSDNSHFTISIYDSSENGDLIYSQTGYLTSILTNNNWQYTPQPDLFPTIDAFTPKAILADGAQVFLRYQNRDSNLDVITSDELPAIPPLFDQFNYTTGSISPLGIGRQTDFNTTSLTPVPVLSSFVFLISGLISFFGFKKQVLRKEI